MPGQKTIQIKVSEEDYEALRPKELPVGAVRDYWFNLVTTGDAVSRLIEKGGADSISRNGDAVEAMTFGGLRFSAKGKSVIVNGELLTPRNTRGVLRLLLQIAFRGGMPDPKDAR